jgi:hypothetical protein
MQNFVVHSQNVRGDGHCGYRALAVSAGLDQGEDNYY